MQVQGILKLVLFVIAGMFMVSLVAKVFKLTISLAIIGAIGYVGYRVLSKK